MEERRLTCIGCPMGCPLVVTMDGGEVVSVTGNTCKRGEIYGRKEVTNEDRDFHSPGIRRKYRHGVGEDERRYPEGKDL